MNTTTRHYSLRPSGPFDLTRQNRHFGGWPGVPGDVGALVMAFPVEGADAAAAVVVRQKPDGAVELEVHAPEPLLDAARRQALATLSLDVDGSVWPEVGVADPLIGELQATYGALRPVLFHSPYEAAAAFIIGHRISIKQGRAVRARLAAEIGASVSVDGIGFPPSRPPRSSSPPPRSPGSRA